MAIKPVHIGCSGWVYKSWRGTFYPEKLPQRLWLAHYAESFPTVEINNTFYRLPSESAVQGWVDQTPPNFRFAVKASRYSTHIKRLREMPERVKRFYEPLEPLSRSGKLGPVLWQLPANFKRDDERLAAALCELPQGRHCFEFRDASWFQPDVYALLREHDVALVIADRPEYDFVQYELTAGWTYVRFHWGSRGRRGNYAGTEIETWARRIAQWRRRVEVYAYFNNDWETFAPRNAEELRSRLRG